MRRRRFLTALGAVCVPALAGCREVSDSAATPTPSPVSTPTATPTAGPTGAPATDGPTETAMSTASPTQTDEPGQQIDPRFGFVGVDGESPPVEADHSIDLMIRPRENAPIPEFYFEPTGLRIDVGDTVRFELATPHHNVNAYHPAFGYTQRLPDGVPPFSSPILTGGDYWLYTFDAEGVHDIVCAPHELFGMVGRVVVGSPTGPGASPVGEAPAPSEESRPPEFTAALVLSDPAMAPDAVADAGSVRWDDLADESKRLLLAAVEESE